MLKDLYKEIPGFQYIVDQLELMSSIGRRRLMEQRLITDKAQLEVHYAHVEKMLELLNKPEKRATLESLRHRLMQLHDLQGTAHRLAVHSYLDEVELFEIKMLAHLCIGASQEAKTLGIDDMLALPNLRPIFDLLDPDGTGMPNFYIYDSYNPLLGPTRKKLKGCQQRLNEDFHDDVDKQQIAERAAHLFERQQQIQQQVIAYLSERLWPYADIFAQALDQLAETDILMAKATQAQKWNLCRPTLSDDQLRFKSLVNPRLKRRNEELHLRYQPVDLELQPGVTLITGANMAGKTVLLKSVAVAQLMAQCGMYVPAQTAVVTLFDDIVTCIGDEQNEMNGLSSFASEITRISQIIDRSAKERLLILIDEPARTTNPIEGKALVQSIATLLDSHKTITMVTTHYSQLGLPCRKLRVKGFVEAMADTALTPDNINRFIDYSLIEEHNEDVPQEALRIATILGCNESLIEGARQRLKTEK